MRSRYDDVGSLQREPSLDLRRRTAPQKRRRRLSDAGSVLQEGYSDPCWTYAQARRCPIAACLLAVSRGGAARQAERAERQQQDWDAMDTGRGRWTTDECSGCSVTHVLVDLCSVLQGAGLKTAGGRSIGALQCNGA